MRIRKRSGAVITSSSSWERARSSTSSIVGSTDSGNGEEFLLPLVAAVMDVQRSEEENKAEDEGEHGTSTTALKTHLRPAHNWRNALQLQGSRDGNSENQVFEDGEEGQKIEGRRKGSMRYLYRSTTFLFIVRLIIPLVFFCVWLEYSVILCESPRRNQWDNIKLFRKEGTEGTLFIKEDSSSGAEKEIFGGRDEEWKPSKSGLLDRGNLPRNQKKLSVRSDKGKGSKYEIRYMLGGNDDETKTSKKFRQDTYSHREDGPSVDDKPLPNKRYCNNNNEAEGSQCRRRNGRGWRCSQRTLVGYSLCEHHLGKGRLSSINSNSNNNGVTTGILINEVGTCKLKELRLIDAS
eukprot:PITA_00881